MSWKWKWATIRFLWLRVVWDHLFHNPNAHWSLSRFDQGFIRLKTVLKHQSKVLVHNHSPRYCCSSWRLKWFLGDPWAHQNSMTFTPSLNLDIQVMNWQTTSETCIHPGRYRSMNHTGWAGIFLARCLSVHVSGDLHKAVDEIPVGIPMVLQEVHGNRE